MAMPKKQLINMTEQQKSWISDVVAAAAKDGQEITQTEVIRALVDQVMVQDPESFVGQLNKIRLRAKLDDIERREKELRDEKEQLSEALQEGNKVTSR